MDWLAVAAGAVVVFILGIFTGVYLLRAELRRNGWRLRIQVDDSEKS